MQSILINDDYNVFGVKQSRIFMFLPSLPIPVPKYFDCPYPVSASPIRSFPRAPGRKSRTVWRLICTLRCQTRSRSPTTRRTTAATMTMTAAGRAPRAAPARTSKAPEVFCCLKRERVLYKNSCLISYTCVQILHVIVNEKLAFDGEFPP